MDIMWKETKASDSIFVYSGRIDFDNPDSPVFVYPASFVRFRAQGGQLKTLIRNENNYYTNTIGVLIDGVYMGKVVLKKEGVTEVDLTGFLPDREAEVTLFKTLDGCHQYHFLGLFSKGTVLKKGAALPTRKIEIYGDSISAGELSEAVLNVGKPDPADHDGMLSNSFYSYGWILARSLNATLHDIAQGGIALFDKEGWYNWPDFIGLESVYDKIEYYPGFGEPKKWDFSKYIPHVVILAFGQNDANPVNYMAEDYEGDKAKRWRARYKEMILELQKLYPGVEIILTTTLLNHDPGWDRAISQVCEELSDPKVHRYLYQRNGVATPGHVRIPEAYEMANELEQFIETLGIDW